LWPENFPKHTHDLEIDYTALSLAVPEKVQFKYRLGREDLVGRLEGRDADWENPEGRRQVFYTNLPPSHYTFRVIASNNDGVWNTTGDSSISSSLPRVAKQISARLGERFLERDASLEEGLDYADRALAEGDIASAIFA
jgi:Y_Y_Y domain